jgi:hypothetical protein
MEKEHFSDDEALEAIKTKEAIENHLRTLAESIQEVQRKKYSAVEERTKLLEKVEPLRKEFDILDGAPKTEENEERREKLSEELGILSVKNDELNKLINDLSKEESDLTLSFEKLSEKSD